MLFKSLILSSVLFLGSSVFAADEVGEVKRTPNKCWNTKLSEAEKLTCASCEQEVEKSFGLSCADEIFAMDLIQGILYVLNEDKAEESIIDQVLLNWQKTVTLKDNCKTDLVNACFVEN